MQETWAITLALPHEAKAIVPKGMAYTQTLYQGFRILEFEAQDKKILLLQTGVGLKRARQATRFLLENFKLSRLISTGYCGALHSQLKTGDLVLASTVVANTASALPLSTDPAWTEESLKLLSQNQSWKVHRGNLLSSLHPLLNPIEKQALAIKYDGIAVDMESHGVLQAAQKLEIPKLVLRFVIDELKDNLEEVESLLEPHSQSQAGRLLSESIKRPKLLTRLPFLAIKAHQARENLKKSFQLLLKNSTPQA
ncbi:MAG: hypothetical protein KDK66_00085 [Deltaproteobacteria bacterium]|nr:hypothetical protein [Deltaproteobacteria bacterium]